MEAATRCLGRDRQSTEITPLWQSDILDEVGGLQGIKTLVLIGIGQLGEVWQNQAFVSFDTPQQDYEMGDSERFHYLQLGHALRTHILEGEQLNTVAPLEVRLLTTSLTDKAFSLVYLKIFQFSGPPSGPVGLVEKRDQGTLENENWVESVQSSTEVAIYTQFRLVQLKILQGTY
ncbi:hypothetical protein NDU88_003967 [Pleurodeles waltl]|uniref:Uncharacterized protein n=1 Tax=Pleurodeles waltl TaxID=8319 RepID=A0AAV7PFC6_PLEWA|nr:hypothetical protein NDU88_003967 [Pleurodeles waltl]